MSWEITAINTLPPSSNIAFAKQWKKKKRYRYRIGKHYRRERNVTSDSVCIRMTKAYAAKPGRSKGPLAWCGVIKGAMLIPQLYDSAFYIAYLNKMSALHWLGKFPSLWDNKQFLWGCSLWFLSASLPSNLCHIDWKRMPKETECNSHYLALSRFTSWASFVFVEEWL